MYGFINSNMLLLVLISIDSMAVNHTNELFSHITEF